MTRIQTNGGDEGRARQNSQYEAESGLSGGACVCGELARVRGGAKSSCPNAS